MAVSNVFFTTATEATPSDGNLATQPADGQAKTKQVSDFITVQSLANFAVMSTAITAGWRALQAVGSAFDHTLWPLALCLLFGLVSVVTSKPEGMSAWLSALFIALINSLVLFGAVIGVDVAVSSTS